MKLLISITSMKYIVVGAGVAGCMLALTLKRNFSDSEVVLLEQTGDVGF